MRAPRREGFTLVELAVAVAIIGVLAVYVLPAMNDWFAAQRLRGAARGVADAMQLARTEAIRTSDVHIVFFATPIPPATTPSGDVAGNALQDAQGNAVPLLVLDDGPLATSNCTIDAGENRLTPLPLVNGVNWGVGVATAPAPLDPALAPYADGITFRDDTSTAQVSWVAFRPDGVPVGFDAACTLGQTGTGSGSIYVTDGNRDYAVTLSALGGARIHAWEEGAGQWTN